MSKTKPHGRKRKKTPTYSLEKLYTNIFLDMTLDLTAPGTPERHFGIKKALENHRAEPQLSYWGNTPYKVKVWRQLELFHKRLVLKQDTPFEELSEASLDDFVDFQQKSAIIDDRALPVIGRAREIVADILGEFSYEDYSRCCQFAKKAALGLSRKRSYLDLRIEQLNGTQQQLNLFNAVRVRDLHLLRATRKIMKNFTCVDSVGITSVPKSYKAARIIAPDTILGGFLSRGLGAYIRDRVEAGTHIDLSYQQGRHQRWAQFGSADGKCATIDMSKASDSFMPIHMKALLPESWVCIVEAMRTERYHTTHGATGYLASSMLMGSGHTFPLQTLLFYAITKAVCELLKERGRVSVYGDDIICPNFAAPPLMKVFDWIGFKVNTEKSFWSSDYMHITKFRESCGGDFYNALDVRPWMPECEATEVKRNEYIAEIHKAIAGLTRRWHPVEVQVTLNRLLQTLASVCTISFVPDTETETSGVKLWILPWLDVDALCLGKGVNVPVQEAGVWRFYALRPKIRNRLSDGRIFYWDWFMTRQSPQLKVEPFSKKKPIRSVAGGTFRREPRRGEKVLYRWSRNG